MLERKCILSIEETEKILKPLVLENLDKKKKHYNYNNGNPIKTTLEITIAGETIYALSDRYKTFFTKGYTCSKCGLTGQFFALEKPIDSQRYHLNLYAIDKNGKEILMTKDHIIPKSKGGKNRIENYQPMCEKCNSKKGNRL